MSRFRRVVIVGEFFSLPVETGSRFVSPPYKRLRYLIRWKRERAGDYGNRRKGRATPSQASGIVADWAGRGRAPQCLVSLVVFVGLVASLIAFVIPV